MSGNSDRLQGSREERSYQYRSEDLESAETYFERQSGPAWRDDVEPSESRPSGRQLMLENGPVSQPSPSYPERRSNFKQGNTYEDTRNSYRSSQPRYETRPPSSLTQERLPSRDSRSRFEQTRPSAYDRERVPYTIFQPTYGGKPLSLDDHRRLRRDISYQYTPPARQETLEEIEARYRREDDFIINGPKADRGQPYNKSSLPRYRTESRYSSRR